MTRPLRVDALSGRDAAEHLDADLRQLAAQLQRSEGRGRARPAGRMRRLADRLVGFTRTHATTVTAAVALTAAIAGLMT